MDKNRVATVEVGSNNQVTVTVPNLGKHFNVEVFNIQFNEFLCHLL